MSIKSMIGKTFAAAIVAAMGLTAFGDEGNITFFDLVETTSESECMSGRPAANAFDNNPNTYWTAETRFDVSRDYSLRVHLRRPFCPTSYTLVINPNMVGRQPKAFKMFGITIGGQEVELDSQEGITWQNVSTLTFPLETDEAFIAFRLKMIEPTGDSSYAFELKDMGFEGSVAPSACVDLTLAARKGPEAAAPFAFQGSADGGSVANLFDGAVMYNYGAALNDSRWYVSKNTAVKYFQVTVDENAFGGGLGWLSGYSLLADQRLNSQRDRLPRGWSVYVSDKAEPTDGDWTLVDHHETYNDWETVEIGVVYKGTFTLETAYPFRTVKFVFDDAYEMQLGEVNLLGFLPESGVVASTPVLKSVSVDKAVLSVGVENTDADGAPSSYDLFCVLKGPNGVETNIVAAESTETGVREVVLDGLLPDSAYEVFFIVDGAKGAVVCDVPLAFETLHDCRPNGFPFGTDYTPLEYIESTAGGSQYIDTGFAPSGSLGFELDGILYNSIAANWTGTVDGWGMLLGVANSSRYAQNVLELSSSNEKGGSGILGWSRGANGPLNAGLVTGERMFVSARKGTYSVVVGEGTRSSLSYKDPKTDNIYGFDAASSHVGVFARMKDTNSAADDFAIMRLYSLKIYDDGMDGELIHDFRPAMDKAGVKGLYDVVAKRWCPNKSVTAFESAPATFVDADMGVTVNERRGSGLSVTLTRNSSDAADVYAVWGEDCGNADNTGWEKTKLLTKGFAAGVKTETFVLSKVLPTDRYVRFYTSAGDCTATIPIADVPVKNAGLAIFFM